MNTGRSPAVHLCLPAILVMLPAPAEAEPGVEFSIPSGTLARSIVLLGQQARIPIILTDGAGRNVRTRPLRGHLAPEDALRQLLDGTGFTFRKSASGGFAVVRARPSTGRPRSAAKPSSRPTGQYTLAPPEPIVVTASKTDTLLANYPGSVAIVDLRADVTSTRPARGTAILIDQLPVLGSTALGPGRNKLYARGVADSSFNGPSQTNVGLYFGDLRLTYNGADPDLNLFDMEKVEVLAGPYGTLYGAGALGGIIRIEANKPELGHVEGRLTADVASVRDGGVGVSVAGMVNLPLIPDRIGIRAVGYRTVDPGFIDAPSRGELNVNGIVTSGGRLALRLEPSNPSTLDLGLIAQSIRGHDSLYTTGGPKSLKTDFPAQPFLNNYLMSHARFRTGIGSFSLVSALGFSRQRADSVTYLLTTDGTDHFLTQQSRRYLLSSETRISGDIGDVQLVAGLGFASNRARDSSSDDISVQYRSTDLALFGEARVALSERVSATLGGRVNATWNHMQVASVIEKQSGMSLLPMAALSWAPTPNMQIHAAYRTGFRAGFPSSFAILGATKSDYLTSVEAGFRYDPSNTLRISGVLSRSLWKNIQEDSASFSGITITNNMGDARIWGLDVNASWKPVPALNLEVAAFFNNGPVVRLGEKFSQLPGIEATLPESLRLTGVAKTSLRAGASYETVLSPGARLNLALALRYYGASEIERKMHQPAYTETGLDARLTMGRWALTGGITNLLNASGNRFAIGNDYRHIFGERQYTPLQPRTVRIGFDLGF